MSFFSEIRALTRVQRNTFSACFLGWTLDAFDFFLLTFCVKAIAADFHVGVKQVAEAIFWTLVMRRSALSCLARWRRDMAAGPR